MRDKETEKQQMSYQSKLMPFPDFQRLKSEMKRFTELSMLYWNGMNCNLSSAKILNGISVKVRKR